MRAFANLLGTNIGTLSKIFSGKRSLSEKMAQKFCDELNLRPDKREKILQALVNKENTLSGQRASPAQTQRAYLENEMFTAMSEWQHMALLQLVRIDVYRSSGWRKRSQVVCLSPGFH